jgi:hypothetical protein
MPRSTRRPPGGTIGIISLTALAVTRPETGLPIGGTEVQLYLLAKALAGEGFEVTLYVADMGQGVQMDGGVRLKPLLPLGEGLRLLPRRFPLALARLVRARHRLCITQGPSAVNGLAGVAARLSGGLHMHMCAHDDEASGLGDVTLSRPAKWRTRFTMRSSASAVSAITLAVPPWQSSQVTDTVNNVSVRRNISSKSPSQANPAPWRHNMPPGFTLNETMGVPAEAA